MLYTIAAFGNRDVLHEGHVSLIDNKQCSSYWNPGTHPILHEMICAGTLPNFDGIELCPADSGNIIYYTYAMMVEFLIDKVTRFPR